MIPFQNYLGFRKKRPSVIDNVPHLAPKMMPPESNVLDVLVSLKGKEGITP